MTEASETTTTAAPSPAKTAPAKTAPVKTAPAQAGKTLTAPAGTARPTRYVGDAFDGDLYAGDSPALAYDGEPAGLARVTLAMRPAEKQPPAPGRLVALASWATAIGIAGLLLAARSGLALLLHPPAWFMPSAVATGLVGIACTAAAFVTAGRRVVPWTLLGVATCAIGISVLLISLLGEPPRISSIP